MIELGGGTTFEFKEYRKIQVNQKGDSYIGEISNFLGQWFDEKTEYLDIKTSGSTGKPKKIQLSKKEMISSAKLTTRTFDLKPGDKILLALPVNYIAGMMMIVRAIVNEMKLIAVKPSLNPLLSVGKDINIDFASFTPAQMFEMDRHSSAQLKKIKQILMGGAPLSPGLEKNLIEYPNRIWMGYGMTETVTHVALRKISGIAEQKYTALEGVSFRKDVENALIVDASHLGKTIVTDDIVELVDSGHFYWLGRRDNVINSGGIKIVPEQIESLIRRIFGIETIIAGIQDEQLGEKVILIVEQPDFTDLNVNDLRQAVKSEFSKFHVPKNIYLLNAIPKSPNAKILRNKAIEKALKLNKVVE